MAFPPEQFIPTVDSRGPAVILEDSRGGFARRNGPPHPAPLPRWGEGV